MAANVECCGVEGPVGKFCPECGNKREQEIGGIEMLASVCEKNVAKYGDTVKNLELIVKTHGTDEDKKKLERAKRNLADWTKMHGAICES